MNLREKAERAWARSRDKPDGFPLQIGDVRWHYLKGFEAGYRRGEADAIAANPEAEALAAADEMAEQLQEDGPLIVEGDAVARYLAARGHPGGPWWPR